MFLSPRRLSAAAVLAFSLAASMGRAERPPLDLSDDPRLQVYLGFRTGLSPADVREALAEGDRPRLLRLLRQRSHLTRGIWKLLREAVSADERASAEEAATAWRSVMLFASVYEEITGDDGPSAACARWKAASPEERGRFLVAEAGGPARISPCCPDLDDDAYFAALDDARRLWHAAGEPLGEGAAIRNRCKRLERTDPDLVADCAREEYALFRQAGFERELIPALWRLARHLPTHEESLETHLSALALSERLNDSWSQMTRRVSIGWEQWMLGQSEDALQTLAEARRRAVELDAPYQEAAAVWRAALVHASAGRWWAADAGFLEALDIYERVGLEPPYFFFVHLSYTASALGLHRQDRWLLERALESPRARAALAVRATLRNRLANALFELEEWRRAEAEFALALDEAREFEHEPADSLAGRGDYWTPSGEACVALLGLLRCHLQAGRAELALDVLGTLLTRLGLDELTSSNRAGSPGGPRDDLGANEHAEPRRLRTLLDESEASLGAVGVFTALDASGGSRALPRSSNESVERYWFLSTAADSFGLAGDPVTRQELELRCWSLARELGDGRLAMHAAVHLAEIALDASDPSETSRWFQEVGMLLDTVEHPGERAAAHFVLARRQEREQRPDAALAGYRRALEDWSRWTLPVRATPTQLDFMGEEHARVIELLGRQSRVAADPRPLLDEALRLAQEARAVRLRELLAARPEVEENDDDALAVRSSDLLVAISRVQLELGSASGAEPSELRAQLGGLEFEHELVEQRRALRQRRLDAEQLPPMELQELQAALPRDGALLMYVLRRHHALVFVVTPNAAALLDLGDPEPIREAAGFFLEVAATRGPADAVEGAGEELFQRLVTPALPRLLGVEQLIVVPDGILHQLPFEALGGSRSLPPMVDWSVTYLPSLALLSREDGVAEPPPRASLLVADPALPGEAARRRGERDVTRHLETRAVYERGGHDLGPLQYARAEGRRIAQLLGKPPPRLLVGADATEAAIKNDDLTRYRLLHFATHSIPDDIVPLRSAVVLAPADGEDGLLQVREILGLDLDAELVVLSGCGTGRGKLVRGEGILGLSRAFLVAGARAVLVSQWSVDDESTRWLMESFYGHLREGVGLGEALRRAKLELRGRDGGRYDHPYYWAPFVLVGDPAAEPLARRVATTDP